VLRLDAVPELAEVEGQLLADEKVAAALSGGLLASQCTKPQPGVQHTITAVQQEEAAARHRAALPTARDKGNLDNAAGPHASAWLQLPASCPPERMPNWRWRVANLFRAPYPQFADHVPQIGPDGAAATTARCKCKACGEQLNAYGHHAFGCTANKTQHTHTHNDVVAAFRDCGREAARGTVTWRVETSVTDLLPAKAGVEVAAADIPRADLVGVSTQGDGPAVVAGVAIALPHNKTEPGEPVPAGTAATQAVEKKRSKYGEDHKRTRGCNAAATNQFGSHVHPESIRLAKAIGAIAARRQALQANVNEAAGPDPVSGVRTGVASTVASQAPARVPVALGHCDDLPARELGLQR
jgi:hypothetical protein